jgi:multidrug efflux pump subunit AcrA (membrane-fusion protein)
MRSFIWLGLGVLVFCLAARGNSAPIAKFGAEMWPTFGAAKDSGLGTIDVVGQTQRAPGRRKKLVPIPGTCFGCQIDDLREVHVRGEVTRVQADELALGQPVELRLAESNQPLASGRLIYIGPISDPRTHRVTVLVRLENRDRSIRCGIPVSMRFTVDPSLVD